MLGRLLVGIVKGLIVGGLIGFALIKIGAGTTLGAVVAYIAAAVTGVLIGLIAGKPIWAKDAKIEAGMKAFVGALLGAGLMYAARRWLTVPIPLELRGLTEANNVLGYHPMTSLALIAAVLGGFYDADNTPEPGESSEAATSKPAQAKGKRIAANLDEDEDEELSAEPEQKRAKR